jgi:hypothetical protein
MNTKKMLTIQREIKSKDRGEEVTAIGPIQQLAVGIEFADDNR